MNYSQLRSIDSRYVSCGLHTYSHISLQIASLGEIVADINKCRHELSSNNINYLPVLAYPYGAYPRDGIRKETFFNLLEQLGIVYGLRI